MPGVVEDKKESKGSIFSVPFFFDEVEEGVSGGSAVGTLMEAVKGEKRPVEFPNGGGIGKKHFKRTQELKLDGSLTVVPVAKKWPEMGFFGPK
jgi:hypothetical protein